MLLYTCGCSCTYGDELKNPKKDAWPIKLAEKLNLPVINSGMCGVSDLFIYRTVLNFILSKQYSYDDLLIVVGWTTKRRYEICIDDAICTYAWCYDLLEKTTTNLFLNNFLENFNISNTTIYIILLYHVLQKYNIKYVFFNSYAMENTLKDSISYYYNIDNYILNHTFNSYCKLYNYSFGKRNHPLESGHSAWSEFLYEYIKKNNILGDM